MVLSRHPSFQQGCIGASSSGCGGAAPPARGYSIKERCHVRLMGLPPVPEFCKATINDIRSGDSQALVQVIGTIGVLRTINSHTLPTLSSYPPI